MPGRKKRNETANPSTYEDIRQRLEDLVAGLERGEGTLEESLGAYEEGVSLVKSAHALLDNAGKRLAVLTGNGPDGFRLDSGDAIAGMHEGDAAVKEDEV